MAPPQPKSGLFVGINKGHVVTKRELPPRPSDRKGVICLLPSLSLLISYRSNMGMSSV
jgi:hypothetical protein